MKVNLDIPRCCITVGVVDVIVNIIVDIIIDIIVDVVIVVVIIVVDIVVVIVVSIVRVRVTSAETTKASLSTLSIIMSLGTGSGVSAQLTHVTLPSTEVLVSRRSHRSGNESDKDVRKSDRELHLDCCT